jgi:riboflavin kinase / FMN adenylyltransferase
MRVVRTGEADGLVLEGSPGSVVTVGTFDGVHVGHGEVLREITRRAARSGRRAVLVTFEPHPLRVIRPSDAPPLLTTLEEKQSLIAAAGVDVMVLLEFTPTLQAYSARRFVTSILLERMGMGELVMGYDHGFGRGREGSVETLRELGGELGFGVDVVQAVLVDGEPVSSTRVRALLGEGDVQRAARLLGRAYSLGGLVVRGEQRGRLLGFPTANLRLDDTEKLLPREGIYAAYGRIDGGERLPGLLHLGPRPTFPGASATVELHLLDWSGDLYGRELRVELCSRLRDVVAYSSAEELVAQMHRDADAGREILARGGSAGCVEGGEPL